MSTWLDGERRHRIELAQRKPSRAVEAVKVLTGQGWTSKNFADVAYAIGQEEQRGGGGRTLQKLIDKSTFAAPASATSGLQSYDLEGASGKKKLKRTSVLSPGKGSFGGKSGKVYVSSYKGEEITEVILSDVEGLVEQGFLRMESIGV